MLALREAPGAGVSESAETAAARVHAAILDALADRPEMVTKWTAVVEFVNDEGRRGCYTLHSPESTRWDALGLLTFSLQDYQASAGGED